MEGVEKFDLRAPEDIKYLIPSWFLGKVNGVDDLWNVDELDAMVRVVGAEAVEPGEGRPEIPRSCHFEQVQRPDHRVLPRI